MAATDASFCRSIVRANARTFWLASQLLPAAKRRAAYAVYAFCRLADDMVDEGVARDVTLRSLDQVSAGLRSALAGRPNGPVFRELARAVGDFGIPAELLEELVAGVAADCSDVLPRDWLDLERYCQGVAASVGEMCTYIFGVEGDSRVQAEAQRRARTLGVAMQLTNILRDIGEDANRGRCYLPQSDLEAFGVTRNEILQALVGREARWRALMQFEVKRARDLYAEAMPGIALLSTDARRCATACAIGYEGILDAIERIGYDTFRTRARLSGVARAAVLWTAWRAAHSTPAPRPALAP